VDGELEITCETAVVVYFTVIFQHLTGGTKKNQETNKYSRSPRRDLNPGIHDYEAGVLIAQLQRSFILNYWFCIYVDKITKTLRMVGFLVKIQTDNLRNRKQGCLNSYILLLQELEHQI
jgi:hypothetical protein